MNDLLLYFAFPISTIILAIVLQKILRNEFLTAGTFFAVYLIVTFTAFDINFLIYAIAYTILAYITAVITKYIVRRLFENNLEDDNNGCRTCSNNENKNMEDDFGNDFRVRNFNGKLNRNYNYFCRR